MGASLLALAKSIYYEWSQGQNQESGIIADLAYSLFLAVFSDLFIIDYYEF